MPTTEKDTICNYPCEKCFSDTRPEYCGMCMICGKWREEKKNTKRNSSGCNICGGGQCDKMRAKNRHIQNPDDDIYWYCCLDLPVEFITKPLKEWLCRGCKY